MNQIKIPKNSGKAPSFQWYPNDWSRDLEEHPLEIEGAWIRIIGKLWFAEKRGAATKTLEQWARILRETPDKTQEILSYIQQEKVGNVTFDNSNSNGLITVTCRRMVRDEKLREQNRLRQEKYRNKGKDNKEVTEEVTDVLQPSSSSSSPSSSPSFSKYEEEKSRKKYPVDLLVE